MASVLKPGVRSSLISGLALSGELVEPVGSGLSDRREALKAARGELFLADRRTSRPAEPTRSPKLTAYDRATNGAAKMGARPVLACDRCRHGAAARRRAIE